MTSEPMEHPCPSREAPFFERANSGFEESGLPHSLGSCLIVSLMLHVMLVVFGVAGFGNESPGQGFGKDGARIKAHLKQPLSPRPAESSQAEPLEEIHSPVQPSLLEELLPVQSGAVASSSASQEATSEAGGFAYYPVDMLTRHPRFLDDLDAVISPALVGKAHGRLVAQLMINSDGRIDSVKVESSELGEQATRIFVQRLNTLRLEPGELKGAPVRARWRLEFNLSPE